MFSAQLLTKNSTLAHWLGLLSDLFFSRCGLSLLSSNLMRAPCLDVNLRSFPGIQKRFLYLADFSLAHLQSHKFHYRPN